MMKNLLLILLISAPGFALAQENLMGKSRAEIKAHFKKENIALYKTDNDVPNASDNYKNDDVPDITCYFDKASICGKELDIEPWSAMAKLQPILARDWVRINDDTWGNKEKTIKIHLVTTMKALGQLYIIYTKYDKAVSDAF